MSYDYGWQPYTYQGCQPDPDCLLIELDGLTFHGRHQSGAYYGITGFDGWDSGAETKGGGEQYDTADGGYQTPVYLGGRSIVITLDINARTHDELWQMRNDVGRILLGSRWAPIVVTDTALGLTRQVDVRRSRPPKITNTSYTTATVTLELESVSAVRVDAVESVVKINPGQTMSIENLGDAPAELVAVFHGDSTDPKLTWPGGEWLYTGPITASTRRVDFTHRTVVDPFSGGRYRLNVSGAWPKVPPGVTDFTYSARYVGASYVELLWRSTWT